MGTEYSVNTDFVEDWLTQDNKKSQMVDTEVRAIFPSHS